MNRTSAYRKFFQHVKDSYNPCWVIDLSTCTDLLGALYEFETITPHRRCTCGNEPIKFSPDNRPGCLFCTALGDLN